jgi:hypothetical protein
MAKLTVRFDIARPRFVRTFVYEGSETERAALKEAMRKLATDAGMDAEEWLVSAVVRAADLLPDAAPNVRQGVISAITAWALDLSAGHPSRHGTIGEFSERLRFSGHDHQNRRRRDFVPGQRDASEPPRA